MTQVLIDFTDYMPLSSEGSDKAELFQAMARAKVLGTFS